MSRVARLELLLREAYHRIANSLQLASTVIGWEARSSGDAAAKARLEAAKHNIEAISGVHALLSLERSPEVVPLHDYMTRLVAGLRVTVADNGGRRRISLRCARIVVRPELAMCLGMIANELVGNACKYAYRHDETGEVRVRFRAAAGGDFALEVEDDGRGLHPSIKPGGSGLGTAMISAIARQIGAELRYDDLAAGTRAVIEGSLPSTPSSVSALSRGDFLPS